jgi:hypothetical protein
MNCPFCNDIIKNNNCYKLKDHSFSIYEIQTIYTKYLQTITLQVDIRYNECDNLTNVSLYSIGINEDGYEYVDNRTFYKTINKCLSKEESMRWIKVLESLPAFL